MASSIGPAVVQRYLDHLSQAVITEQVQSPASLQQAQRAALDELKEEHPELVVDLEKMQAALPPEWREATKPGAVAMLATSRLAQRGPIKVLSERLAAVVTQSLGQAAEVEAAEMEAISDRARLVAPDLSEAARHNYEPTQELREMVAEAWDLTMQFMPDVGTSMAKIGPRTDLKGQCRICDVAFPGPGDSKRVAVYGAPYTDGDGEKVIDFMIYAPRELGDADSPCLRTMPLSDFDTLYRAEFLSKVATPGSLLLVPSGDGAEGAPETLAPAWVKAVVGDAIVLTQRDGSSSAIDVAELFEINAFVSDDQLTPIRHFFDGGGAGTIVYLGKEAGLLNEGYYILPTALPDGEQPASCWPMAHDPDLRRRLETMLAEGVPIALTHSAGKNIIATAYQSTADLPGLLSRLAPAAAGKPWLVMSDMADVATLIHERRHLRDYKDGLPAKIQKALAPLVSSGSIDAGDAREIQELILEQRAYAETIEQLIEDSDHKTDQPRSWLWGRRDPKPYIDYVAGELGQTQAFYDDYYRTPLESRLEAIRASKPEAWAAIEAILGQQCLESEDFRIPFAAD